jgi:hypothetical protein
MVPIRDESGRQIAWWSTGLGWITFETVSRPGYDYVAEYQAWIDNNTPRSCEEAQMALGTDLAC